MESEVSSKAPVGTPRNPGLSTVYVPLNHKHHEVANVLYGVVGNPADSLPPVDSRHYLDFFHRMMKARPPLIPNSRRRCAVTRKVPLDASTSILLMIPDARRQVPRAKCALDGLTRPGSASAE